jgi:AcrR family transcriptional regulator
MTSLTSQERIITAATKVFTLKGLEGARMQDIADGAQINKAMLHYYFKNKQQLFEIIFDQKLNQVIGAITSLLNTNISFEQRIREFVEKEISIIKEFPSMPLFVIMEVRKNPSLLLHKLNDNNMAQIREKLSLVVKYEIEAGRIRSITVDELFMNIISLCIYPIVAEPVIKQVLNMTDQQYEKILDERKKTIADLIINDLKRK